jgi:hypothetical protein
VPSTNSTGDVLVLQRLVGNHSVGSVLQRRRSAAAGAPPVVVQRAAPDGERAQLVAAESALDQVSATCTEQSAQFGSITDTAVDQVTAARTRLKESSAAYRAGHTTFASILAKADKQYESDKSAEDAVQSVLVAAALAIVAPEALITVAALRKAGLLEVAQLEATVSGVRAVEGAIGEVIEIRAGKAVDATKDFDNRVRGGGPGRPSDSAGGGGPSAGDRFEEAFGQLDSLVAALPRIGSCTSAAGAIARAAEQLARDSVKLRNGEPVARTAAEITERVVLLQECRDKAARSLQSARALAASVAAMSEQIVGKPILTPLEVEDRLWTAWMAGLGKKHDLLDNKEIEDYLGPKGKGFLDFGKWYTSDADEAEAIATAQIRFLQQNAIPVGPNPSTQYFAEMAARRVRSAVMGKRGTITGPRTVAISGQSYAYAQNAGVLTTGTEVVAKHAAAPHRFATGQVNAAAVDDSEIDVYCDVRSGRSDDLSVPPQPEPVPVPPP